MKKVLITGEHSYIGNSFANFVGKIENNQIDTDFVSLRTNEWQNLDFSQYDTILHVAGIAHVSADPKRKDEYFKINRDLTEKIAKKAKLDGVGQFIFMSSMIVYGEKEGIINKTVITRETKPKPIDFYGDSKLQADLLLQKMETTNFKVVIVRTPMVFGPGSKGNFPLLVKIAKLSPIFPKIDNQRSMIFIDNLSNFLMKIIIGNLSGIFFPQNSDYFSTTEIIRTIRDLMNKRIILTPIFNWLIIALSSKFRLLNKIYGNKIYTKDTFIPFDYVCVSNIESIKKTIELNEL